MERIEFGNGFIVGENWDAIRSLQAKMVVVADSIGRVEKDANVSYGKVNYDYVSYEALAVALRSAMIKHGVCFAISSKVLETEKIDKYDVKTGEKYGEDTRRVIEIETMLSDSESGAMQIVRWAGEGQDGGDKATSKAITLAVKYGLMRTFLCSEKNEIDPDAEIEGNKGNVTRKKEEPPKRELVPEGAPGTRKVASESSWAKLITRLSEDSTLSEETVCEILGEREDFGTRDLTDIPIIAKEMIEDYVSLELTKEK